MEQYSVTGMSCAACAARVEQAVSKLEGVSSCSVSLLTNSMGIEGTASQEEILQAVRDAGYDAKKREATKEAGRSHAQEEELLADHESPVLKKRLLFSLIFLLLLMYLSMGHHMFGWPLPSLLAEDPVAGGIVQMLLSGIVLVINQKFFRSGFRGLLHRAPNMDTLVALGSGVSFVYSVGALVMMSHAQATGDAAGVMRAHDNLYFESAAMILTLITVGKLLEARSKGKTTDALRALMALSPKTATLLQNGKEVAVPIEEVQVGSIFVVRPGESIPVDGIIIDGNGAINEAALTGESIPIDKKEGDAVSAATNNQDGYLTCRATRVGEDTTLSQIIQMVGDAAATKAPIAKIADRVSGIFVPVVMAIALITFVIWMLLGESAGFSISRAIAVLVISCPCALGLATPVAIMVGNGLGARRGILFKTAAALEQAGRTQIVALDKTGTITRGEPSVTDVIPAPDVSREDLLACACSLEQYSEHPLAKAIDRYGKEEKITCIALQDFRAWPGHGLTAEQDGVVFRGGNPEFLENISLPETIRTQADALAEEGKTPLFFAKGEQLLGMIAVADTIKEDSAAAIAAWKEEGIRVVMLTGDNARTAQAIGRQAGVSEVISGVLPEGKEEAIRSLQEQGSVAMIGDGINDAPALTRADTGIAIGAGADVAVDAADVVLVKSSLQDAVTAIRLSRATVRTIHQNLFWAFFYNVICIPLAAGAYVRAFGWTLNPMIAAAAMSFSSVSVVLNALRLHMKKI